MEELSPLQILVSGMVEELAISCLTTMSMIVCNLKKIVTMQNFTVDDMIYVAHSITMMEAIVSHIGNSDQTLQATKQIIFAGNCMKVKLLRKTSQDTHGL